MTSRRLPRREEADRDHEKGRFDDVLPLRPAPQELIATGAPGKTELPILVFDGDCGFCSSAVRWLEQRVAFTAEPWQLAPLAEYKLTAEETTREVWVISSGVRIGGSAAVGWMLRRARSRTWRAVGLVLTARVSAPLAEWVHRIVASNRHRLPGGTAACELNRVTTRRS